LPTHRVGNTQFANRQTKFTKKSVDATIEGLSSVLVCELAENGFAAVPKLGYFSISKFSGEVNFTPAYNFKKQLVEIENDIGNGKKRFGGGL
jgi:hypothetical protein